MTDELVVERRGSVVHVVLNRPEHGNALTAGIGERLAALWPELRDDPQVEGILITGAGSRHFCTGADLRQVAERGRVPEADHAPQTELRWAPSAHGLWKPIVCAVNGLVAGAGLHFVTESDIVLADPGAAFMDTHTSVGMVGALENIGLLTRLPVGAVMLMTLCGRGYRMSAERAYELGLVDLLAEPGKVVEEADELLARIVANSPAALRGSKEAIWTAARRGRAAGIEAAWRLIRAQWTHPDFLEGSRAFAENRSPNWARPPDPPSPSDPSPPSEGPVP